MNELYEMIEKKIKESGYPRPISGSDVYDDICDQIEGKENGSYVVLSKFDDDVIFEYHITVMDDEGVFEADFDQYKRKDRVCYLCRMLKKSQNRRKIRS